MEINIQTTVSNNRTPLSIMGSNLGKQFFQVDVRDSWPNFEAEKSKIQMENNQRLILNRSPRRYLIKAKDIVGLCVSKDISGDAVLCINPHDDGDADVKLPITNDMVSYGIVTQEAVKEALKGTSTKVFSDPKKLCAFLNELNNKELVYLRELKESINKMEQGIISTIADNNKKSSDYIQQISVSIPPTGETPKVEVNIHNN